VRARPATHSGERGATEQPAPHRGGSFVCQVLHPDEKGIARAVALLKAGELVGLPTETVYGLAADARNAEAVGKIFEVKNRPAVDPLIVHLAKTAQAAEYAFWNDAAETLASCFWPGPLTLVLPHCRKLPAAVTSGGSSVALRCPAHPVARAVLEACDFPLAAPSANPFGYLSPTTATHVLEGLGEHIAAVLDGGSCACGVESTIVDARNPVKLRLLRPGGLSPEEIFEKTGMSVEVDESSSGTSLSASAMISPSGDEAETAKPLVAPGTLSRHYSPRTPLTLFSGRPPLRGHTSEIAREAVLFLACPLADAPSEPSPSTFWLSATGEPREAEQNLYAVLRQLDAAGYQRIFAERPPATGAFRALHDRLQRAAATH
jgi:L-threonylcarbamoyladenylate synthase